MTTPATKQWTTVCHLTTEAMDALGRVEESLIAVEDQDLSPLEFRTLMWARCSLATLYGIRADETVDGASLSELQAMLDAAWSERPPA